MILLWEFNVLVSLSTEEIYVNNDVCLIKPSVALPYHDVCRTIRCTAWVDYQHPTQAMP